MAIYDSRLWIEDINTVMRVLPELDDFAGKAIMITGATGLICSSVVDILLQYNETHDVPIRIFAAGRQMKKMIDRFGLFCSKPYFEYVSYDALKKDNEVSVSADYIIHGAGNAYPGLIVKEPVETMLSNFTGMLYLLDYAKKSGVKRILYISSSEVYGKKVGDQPYSEDEYGYIDILNPRNSYSVGKRAAETLCSAYAAEYGVDSVIVRPGHVYGPTASPTDNHVSSAWAHAAACGEDIVMKSNGTQLRSYCYCLDCASAILKVLIKGKSICAYNISNPESIISIKEMAEILVNATGVNLIQEEADEMEKSGFNPMSNSSLDSVSLQKLGWQGLFNADKGFSHTVSILKDMNS